MAPHKSTRFTAVSSSQNVSFLSKGKEGENVEQIICTPKYITVQELRKTTVVTDRLHRDYQDLKSFDRVLVKCGVRKILTTIDVIQAVNNYWSGGISDGGTLSINNDNDSLVSDIII